MKVRLGFVSNSSSSSFCIYGTSFNFDDIDIKKLKKRAQNDPKLGMQLIDTPIPMINTESEDFDNYELGEAIADALELEYHSDSDGDYYCLGRSYSNINDDETGEEFKKSVEKKIELLFGDEKKCHYINHTYYC